MEGKKKRKKRFLNLFRFSLLKYQPSGEGGMSGWEDCENVEKTAFYYNQIKMSDIGKNMYTPIFEIFAYLGYGKRSQQ